MRNQLETSEPAKTRARFAPVYEAPGSFSVRLETADVEHPPGNRYTHHRLIVADGRPAAILVAERTGVDASRTDTQEAAAHGTEVLLVRSLRIAAETMMWELPRGSSDAADAQRTDAATGSEPADRVDEYSDEALIRAGLRELREETGHTGRDPAVIGRYLTDSTMFPQRAGVVHCLVDRDETPQGTDGEVEESRWVTHAELRRMIAAGEIRDSHTLAALTLLANR